MAGPTVAAVRIAGPVRPWRDVGFTPTEDGRIALGAVQLQLGGAGQGIVGWVLTGEGPAAVDGIPTEWVASAAPRTATAHPNTAVTLDHVVVRTADPGATFAALGAVGMQLRAQRTAEVGGRAVRQGFFRHGEAIVEVVGPEPPGDPAPSRLWGLTVTVADIEACAALLGLRLGAVRDAVQPGRRIATVARDAGLGVPLAVMSA